jgi:WhiB family redox-sensing transcriptional regulator
VLVRCGGDAMKAPGQSQVDRGWPRVPVNHQISSHVERTGTPVHPRSTPLVADYRGDPGDLIEALDLEPRQVLARFLGAVPSWQRDALCREYPLALWFPSKGQTTHRAVAICRRCLVRAECLAEALADESLDHGIRAGYTTRERQALRANPQPHDAENTP